MRLSKKSAVGIVLLLTLLTGCDNPKAANDENFKKAIVASLPQKDFNCFGIATFPYFQPDGKKDEELETLKNLGILSTSRAKQYSSFLISLVEEGTKYSLTELGQKYYKQDKNEFCVGELEFDKVRNFTSPEDESGVRVSRVIYSYKVKNLPQWALDSKVQASTPALARIAGSSTKPLLDSTKLFLTDKGWVEQP